MKKIAFIAELYGTKRQGGEHIAMHNVANALLKKKLNVDFYSYSPPNKKFIIKTKIPLKLLSLPFIRDMVFSPILGNSILRKLDKSYTAIFTSTTTLAAFYRPESRLIIVCHAIRSQKFEVLSNIPKYKLMFNPFTYFVISVLEKKSLTNADNIIVIRKHQKNFLIKEFNIDTNKIKILPNGVDTNLFKPSGIKKNQVIFVGRGTIPKGLKTLLKASEKIKSKVLIVTQKIDSDLLDVAKKIPNVVIKYNLKPKELARCYAESKVFVLPSLDEEQPLTTIEAMSSGLPVVVTKKAGGGIIKDKVNGFVIPNNDDKKLYLRCNELLSSPKLRKKLGAMNRKKILRFYSLEKISTQFFKTT